MPAAALFDPDGSGTGGTGGVLAHRARRRSASA